MITALEIENFKAIGPRQRIELAPITLLFGPNSAGKSTILHALLYLHTVLKTGDPDVDQVELGGETVRLGGFRRLAHRQGHGPVRIRVEFNVDRQLNLFGRDLSFTSLNELEFDGLEDLDDEIRRAWIEIEVRADEPLGTQGAPSLSCAKIGVGDHKSPVLLVGRRDHRCSTGLMIDPWHPIFATEGADEPHSGLMKFVHGGACSMLSDRGYVDWDSSEVHSGHTEADTYFLRQWDPEELPEIDFPGVVLSAIKERTTRSVFPALDAPLVLEQTDGEPPDESLDEGVRTLVEMLLLGVSNQLMANLDHAVHVGPLRTIPPPGALYEQRGRVQPWSSGLAAWDELLADEARSTWTDGALSLTRRTSDWMERLGVGCGLEIVEPVNQGDPIAQRRLVLSGPDGHRSPNELGAGISQLVPVIVALLRSSGRLCMIEQPELHVHPALQVGIGDLLIEAAIRGSSVQSKKHVFVETHSEHLLLRLLRRVRQTTEGDLAAGHPRVEPSDVSVLYINPDPVGARVVSLRIDETGEFLDRWPKGFFVEREEELF